MGHGKLEGDYKRVLEEALARGAIQLRTGGVELRKEPRILPGNGHIRVRVEPDFSMINVSASGLAFHSDLPFTPGGTLTIVLEDAFNVAGRVIGCSLEETDPSFLETHYRVQCRFEDLEQGKQLLVRLEEMERLGKRTPG
jgi:hypothetical protein